jgi:hypothetical protein
VKHNIDNALAAATCKALQKKTSSVTRLRESIKIQSTLKVKKQKNRVNSLYDTTLKSASLFDTRKLFLPNLTSKLNFFPEYRSWR